MIVYEKSENNEKGVTLVLDWPADDGEIGVRIPVGSTEAGLDAEEGETPSGAGYRGRNTPGVDQLLLICLVPALGFAYSERPSCGSDEFRCNDGRCIDDFRRCDYIMDCTSGEDEANCPNIKCKDHQFRCRDGTCIDASLKCNNVTDCPNDNFDELYCPCTADQFECTNRHCIPRSRKCDGYNDCQDGSDESDCRMHPFVYG
uniref:Uncharacterized protein n=1 Tax=Timema cristinae TaxID=61476 RepID=A0A7R9C9I9_TIMCR|nr:unnamed protein product [Timema cristinae]